MSYPIVFFDLETGGFEWWPVETPGGMVPMRPITQIAAIAIDRDSGEQIGDAFEMKVRFNQNSATKEALEVNHFSEGVWEKEALHPKDVVDEFTAWLKRHAVHERIGKSGRPYRVAELFGHNAASFDMPFLKSWFNFFHKFLPADLRVFDTLQMAQVYQAVTGMKFENLQLGTIAKEFNISVDGDAHDALTDVRMTVGIYKAMLARLMGAVVFTDNSKAGAKP